MRAFFMVLTATIIRSLFLIDFRLRTRILLFSQRQVLVNRTRQNLRFSDRLCLEPILLLLIRKMNISRSRRLLAAVFSRFLLILIVMSILLISLLFQKT